MTRMRYTVHEDLNIVELVPSGVIHVTDILEYGNRLISHGEIRAGTIEYVDMSNMKDLTVTYRSAHDLKFMHEKWLELGWLGSVYNCVSDTEYGLVRMVSAIVETLPGCPQNLMFPLRKSMSLDHIRPFLLSKIDN